MAASRCRHEGNADMAAAVVAVDMAAVGQEIADLKAELAEVEDRMAAYLRELGL